MSNDETLEPGFSPIIGLMRKRFKMAVEAEQEQRIRSLDDLRFCDPDSQWSAEDRASRDADGRPCLTVDRTTPFCKQIVNGMRQNPQSIKVIPLGDGAQQDAAEIREGMMRDIQLQSNASQAYITGYESTVRSGIGYWRVVTDYCDDNSFEQEIKIKRIANWMTVYIDPTYKEADGSDIEWAFVVEDMTREEMSAAYPRSMMATNTGDFLHSLGDDEPNWILDNGKLYRLADYYTKEYETVTICKLEDGRVVEKSELTKEDGVPVKERKTRRCKVMVYKTNGVDVLEKVEIPCDMVPVVPCFGDELNINGKRIYAGVIRTAKDPQRLFNFMKTAQAESIDMSAKAPWVGPEGFDVGHEEEWRLANRKFMSSLKYAVQDFNGQLLPPPQRNVMEPAIQAITLAMRGAEEDLKATTGMYDPSLGVARAGEQSGKAIQSLQSQGAVSNYHFADNFSRALKLTGKIILKMMPRIYDTARMVRIVKPDETIDMAAINGYAGSDQSYDMSSGRYDVTVETGPAFGTKRQENLQSMLNIGQSYPPFFQLGGDIVVGQMDFPGARELQERFKKMLPPQLQEQGGPQMSQQQIQALMQQHEQLTQAVNELQQQLDGKDRELETKRYIAELNNQTELIKAQIQANSASAELQLTEELAFLKHRLEAVDQIVQLHAQNQLKPAEAAASEEHETSTTVAEEPNFNAGDVAEAMGGENQQ